MSLFEWMGEIFDPQPTGSVDCGSRYREYSSRTSIYAFAALAVLILAGWACLIVCVFHVRTWHGAMGWLAGTLIYLVAGYFIHPAPDMDNLGWFGGLFDDPFHWSDDYNRTLLGLQIVLWPGRFLSESIVDCCVTLIGSPASENRKPRKSKRSRKRDIAAPRDVPNDY